jgi:hypothetical protein
VIRHPATLLRLHEALCFLQAHPDDPKILELVDRALDAFGARLERLSAAARREWIRVAKGAADHRPAAAPRGVRARASSRGDARLALREREPADSLAAAGAGGARTLARIPTGSTFFHADGLDHGAANLAEARRRPVRLRRGRSPKR